MEYLLLLGANQFQRERAIAGAEKAFAGPIVVCSSGPEMIPNNFATYTIFVGNESDPHLVLQAVLNFNSKYNARPKYVIPINDFVLDSSLAIAKAFDCSTNGKDTIKFAREKNLMKQQFKKFEIPHEESLLCDSFNQLKENSEKINLWPQVIKPVNFGGSGGVIKINSKEELKQAYDLTMNHLNTYATKYNSIANQVLIEKYIPYKDEISVEVLNTPTKRMIVGITKKFLGPEPYFSEVGHLADANTITNEHFKKTLEDVSIKACEALNIKYGLAHVEIKINYETKEFKIVEVGARPAGDGIIDLWEKVTEQSIYSLHCLSYMEQLNLNDINLKYLKTTAIGYFSFPIGEILKINEVCSIFKDYSFVEKINIRCQVGQKTSTPKDWSTRYGFINYLFNKQQIDETNLDIQQTTQKLTDKIFEIQI